MVNFIFAVSSILPLPPLPPIVAVPSPLFIPVSLVLSRKIFSRPVISGFTLANTLSSFSINPSKVIPIDVLFVNLLLYLLFLVYL